MFFGFCFSAFLFGVVMGEFSESDNLQQFPLPWETILGEYKQALETANKSPKTIDGYLGNLRKYFAFLGTHGLMKPVHKLGVKESRECIMHNQTKTRCFETRGVAM